MLHRLAKKVVEAARQHISAEAARMALEARNEAETVAAAINGVRQNSEGNPEGYSAIELS